MFQIGLVDILFALGITPDGIVGHSVGELGCAYADGCFTAEQMILAAHARGKASIETDTIDGKMAAIGLGYKQMKDMLADYPTIEIACHNASDSCTLSGPSADVEALVESLVAQGIFARAVNVANIAYHSRYIAPAAPRLLQYLKKVIPSPKPRSSKWISSSILEDAWGSPLAQTSSAEYHTNNLLSSVFFEEASAHIPANAICIEIAPHGLLQAILKRSLAEKEVVNIPLTLRGVKDGVKFILNSIGKLYLNGLDLNLAPLYPEVQYPVSRGTKPLGHFVDWEHGHEYKLSELEVQIKSYPADEEFAGLFHEVYKTNVNRHTLRGYVLTPDTSAQDETENLEQVE
ncbi:fatty acid synthase, partial [Diaphorina citri]|uniref:Fatty acid synthase n=1 Tax=Diaphorina citri TaxID=121845 RepID=A0A3Q0JKI9_DIACI